MVWCGLVWFGIFWFDLLLKTPSLYLGPELRYHWFGLVWYGLVWFGMVWYGMVWFGLVWFDVLAKTPGLYQGPKLRNLNFIFWDRRTGGGRDRVTYISARSRIKMVKCGRNVL